MRSTAEKSEGEPRLAAPGAGLPEVERVVGGLIFRWNRWTLDREGVVGKIEAGRAGIRELIRSCSEEMGSRRVLIERVRGMEDSSRYWSVWMTLEHLRIVHEAIAGVIQALGEGQVPPGEASTAAVKPSVGVTGAVREKYEDSCEAVLAAITSVPDLRTSARFPHPWFGPLDAQGWAVMIGGHLAIHRQQIERILAGLPR